MANISRSYSNGSAIKVEYSYTQNVSKNQSTLTMTLYVHRDSYGPSWNTHCNSYIRLDGSNVMTYTGSFNISTSWVKIGSTVTKTVTHNADGTKSISITGFFDSQGLTSKLDDLSCSGTVTLKTIPRASSISSITGDTIGETVTIRLSRASSSFTHRLYYTFGDTKNRLLSSSVATSYSFKPSMNDCAYLPNGTSGTATIRADTYNGSTKIGSASKNFTLKVPSSVVPTLSGVSVTRVDGDVPEDWGVYVKGKSSAKVQINGAAGAYGSTIKAYAISGGDYSGTTNPFTTGALNTAGEVTFTGKITDSRGRTASGSASITVEDYAPPVLTSVEAHRCSASGELQDDGEYITLTAVFSGSTVGGRNAITGKYRRMPEGGDWTSLSSLTSGQAVVFPASGDSTFSVEVQVSDAFTTISQAVVVNSVEFIMDFKAGGTGIAFGKAAEYDDTLDCNWEGHFRKNVQVDGSLSVGIPAAGEQGVRFSNHLWMYYNEDETPTAHIYQPYAQKLSFSIRNGTGESSDLEWMGENGGSNRYILRPMENGGAYLGTTSMRWNTGFFTNTITQSDQKDKENIAAIPNAKAFIMALEPIAYTLKDGDGGRIHMGFAAQAVAQAAQENQMGDLSLYQAAVIGEDGTETYYTPDAPEEQLSWGLNYHEFIAPLVALVQEQEARIAALEAQVAALKEEKKG